MTEMTPVVVHHPEAEQGRLLAAEPVPAAHVAEPRKKGSALKPIIALSLLGLSIILFGLLAFQAHRAFGGGLVDSTGEENEAADRNTVGFNGAGDGMFVFGLLFAVLQAVTAYAMWLHIAYWLPHYKHNSILAPLKVTVAVGFIAMGFACRHINLGADEGAPWTHVAITHAIESFLIINWFFVLLVLIVCLTKVNWDCENLETHRVTRRMAAGYAQFDSALVLIGLLSAYFQLYTEGYYERDATVHVFLTFAIMFAVLQAISGLAMIQQCGHHAPGQFSEVVYPLLKVVIAFGLLAFGFACRSIYVTRFGNASALLIAIEAFVIINFALTLLLSVLTARGSLIWINNNEVIGKRTKGTIFGVVHIVLGIILFGLLAALLQGLTGHEQDSTSSINAAGIFMVHFGLLFAVLQFFVGLTILESSPKKLGGLDPSTVSVVHKVTFAIGALAFGFACRHINLSMRVAGEGPRAPLVHAIESFIIINFFATWLVEILGVKGKVDW